MSNNVEIVQLAEIPPIKSVVNGPAIKVILQAYVKLADGQAVKYETAHLKAARSLSVALLYYRNKRARPGTPYHPGLRISCRGSTVFCWKDTP